MGPSGSGKTTLLDILSGRKTEGKTEGIISFSGSTPTRAFLRRYTGCAFFIVSLVFYLSFLAPPHRVHGPAAAPRRAQAARLCRNRRPVSRAASPGLPRPAPPDPVQYGPNHKIPHQ